MTAAPPRSALAESRPALAAFAAMGICWGAFAAELPDLKAMIGVDETRLGLMLFATPLAAVLAMLAAPWASRAFERHVLPVVTLAMAAAFALPGQASAWVLLPLAMLACGAATGVTDVLMNARMSAIEAARGQSLMNLAHAAYSLAYAAAALIVGALRSAGQPPPVVMAALAAVALGLALLTVEGDGRIEGLDRPRDRAAAHLGRVPLIGGGMVLLAFMTENAAENWSALHIETTLGGSPAAGSAGPAVLALTMGLARLGGHGIATRVAPLGLILGGAAIAALGVTVAALAATPALAYLGFITMGIGASVISPTAFTLVGRRARPEARARAVARATMLGYFGYFFGPPTMGFLAGSFGLRAAFLAAAGLLLLIMALAPLLARAR